MQEVMAYSGFGVAVALLDLRLPELLLDDVDGDFPFVAPLADEACPASGMERAGPHPARLHPQGRLLAEPAGRLVADFPAPGAGRAGLRRPRRDHLGHPGGHRPAQRPRLPLGLGTAPAQHRSYRRRFVYTL
jgi:hypothetical protein